MTQIEKIERLINHLQEDFAVNGELFGWKTWPDNYHQVEETTNFIIEGLRLLKDSYIQKRVYDDEDEVYNKQVSS